MSVCKRYVFLPLCAFWATSVTVVLLPGGQQYTRSRLLQVLSSWALDKGLLHQAYFSPGIFQEMLPGKEVYFKPKTQCISEFLSNTENSLGRWLKMYIIAVF